MRPDTLILFARGIRGVVLCRIAVLALSVLSAALATPSAMAQPAAFPAVHGQSHQPVQRLTREEAFALGLQLMQDGQPREAAALFSAILAHDPDLVRVRLELARAWFLSEQWGRARSEFLSVLSGDIPDPVRDNVERFLHAIDARRGFEWQADIGLAMLGETRNYDSNTTYITFGGQELPFTLNRSDRTVPGLTFRLGAGIREEIAPLSGETLRTVAFANIRAEGEEGPGSEFDDLTLTASPGLRLIWRRAALTLAPSLSRRFVRGTAFEDRVGGSATLRRRSPEGTSVTLSGSWHRIDNLEANARDGHIARASLTVSRPLTPRLSLGATLLAESREARSPVDDYRRLRLTGFGTFDAGRGVTLSPSLWVESLDIERDTPGAADHTATGISLKVESSRLIFGNGFTPYVQLEAARARAARDAFSWTDYGARIGFTRRF